MKLNIILNRVPSKSEVYASFGPIVFAVFSWSFRGFIHKLPSFLYYFSLGDILSILSYMMAVALLESLLFVLGLLFLAFIFPASWLRQGFVYKSFLFLAVGITAMILLQETMKKNMTGFDFLLPGVLVSVAVLAVLIFLFHKAKLLQKPVELIVDRLGVFSYVYVPLGVISLVVVIIRNLF